MRRLLTCAMVALALALGPRARAHEIQPAFLEFQQTAPDTYTVLWKVHKVPGRPYLRDEMEPQFPAADKITSERTHSETADAYIEQFTLNCPHGLIGQSISLTGTAAAVADTLVRVEFSDGSVEILRISPATPSVIITTAPGNWSAFAAFISLGIEHVLTGVDHLLFVFGLLLLVRNGWMLLKTVTAFTIAHSITLAIATFGYVSVPIPPLNASIALSILFLGPEIMRMRHGGTGLTIRRPWVVAVCFGLLHGLGFASGLTSLGLPHREIPLALLGFNVGVEIGQVSFVIVILLMERSFRVLQIRWPRWMEDAPAYVVGSLGAYWTIRLTWVMLASLG